MPQLRGEVLQYVSWQEMAARLPGLVGRRGGQSVRAFMEYSPGNAVPYISRIDAGIKEVVEGAGVEVLSSADVAQLVLAVLTPEQVAGHRSAAAVCLAAKDAGFDFIAERLHAGRSGERVRSAAGDRRPLRGARPGARRRASWR